MKIFSNSSGRARRLQDRPFDNEKLLQNLIEENLDTVLDLEFLTTEFRIKDLRPDSVAYDSEKNCFVIIEYKNVKNKQVLDQGATYYRLLKEHQGDFVLLYNRQKDQQRGTDSFNWDESYVVFLSPEFTKYQIGASGIGLPVQLYRVRQYDQGIITLEQVGDLSVKRRPAGETKSEDYYEEDYLDANASKETRKLYFEAKREILDNFEELKMRQRKMYVGFYLQTNNEYVCTISVIKSKIKLAYSVTASKNILSPSEFVRDVSNVGKWGVGHYQSEIENMEDVKLALPFIRKVYDYKMKN